jgi:lauroyl/myristoyl acyltransferase
MLTAATAPWPDDLGEPQADLLPLTGQTWLVRLYGSRAFHRIVPTAVAVRLAELRGRLEWHVSAERRVQATRAVQSMRVSADACETRALARRRVVEEAVRAELEWRPWIWRNVDVEGAEHLHSARRLQDGRLIVASVHLGPYVCLAHVVAAQGLRPHLTHGNWTSAPALHGRRGRWTFQQMQSLEEQGGRFVPRGRSYRSLVALLERGETCMFALDVRGREQLRLAGRPVRVRRGVATLARTTHAPIVPGLVFRDGSRPKAVFFPPLDPRDFDEPNALTQRVFDVLSPTVIAHAEQAHANLVRLGDLAQGVERER